MTKVACEVLIETTKETTSKIALLVNANNKGYCRVVLQKEDMNQFAEMLSDVDTLNRCYLWRILYDQVRLKALKPINFIDIVCKNILLEQEEKMLPYILGRVNYIVDYGLIAKDDTSEKEKLMEELANVIEKKMEQNMKDESLVNTLLGYYILFCPELKVKNLLHMAKHSSFPEHPEIKINKR